MKDVMRAEITFPAEDLAQMPGDMHRALIKDKLAGELADAIMQSGKVEFFSLDPVLAERYAGEGMRAIQARVVVLSLDEYTELKTDARAYRKMRDSVQRLHHEVENQFKEDKE